MKKILSVLFLFCLFGNVFGQRGAILKSYAYAQEFMPGTQQQDAEVKTLTTYFIYLEIAKKTDVAVKYIWIGKNCSVPNIATNVKSPVVIVNNGAMNTKEPTSQLVPKTSNTILQIMPTETIDDKNLRTGKRLACKNAFVIAYIYKGKWCYYSGKAFKSLAMQFGM